MKRSDRNDVLGCLLALVLVPALYGVVIALLTFPVRWGWQLVAVRAFDAPDLTYWQVFAGIVALSIIGGLFGKRGGK